VRSSVFGNTNKLGTFTGVVALPLLIPNCQGIALNGVAFASAVGTGVDGPGSRSTPAGEIRADFCEQERLDEIVLVVNAD